MTADRLGALGNGIRAWGMAPIRWGGYFALDLQSVSQQGQLRRSTVMESANIGASSYIWQPWFAQVSGDLTLLAAQQRGDGSAAGAPSVANSSPGTNSITGSAQLALFPVSRFPFTASYSESDSRVSGELTNSPYTSRRYTLSQAFAPLEGGSSYRVSFTRSDLNSGAVGSDTAKSLTGSMNWGKEANTFRVDGTRYTNLRTQTGDSAAVDTVNAAHNFRAGPTFSVDSLANFSDSAYHFTSLAQPLELRTRFLQFNSVATWRPSETSPLLVVGGARLFQNAADTNGASAESTTLSANAAATYMLNRNTTLSGGGTLTRMTSGDRATLYSLVSGGISYNSDTVQWGPYGYTWNASANAADQRGGENSKVTLGTQAGHRLLRNFVLDEGSMLTLNASQDYSLTHDSVLSNSQSVLHRAGAAWSRRAGENATTLLAVDASDMRSWGYSAQKFQLLNVQATGQIQFSRWSTGNANVTLQVARQGVSPNFSASAGVPQIGRTTVSTAGNVSYQNSRAFGVPRLSYLALLNLNQRQQRTRLEGDINAPIEHVDWSFEQRLNYVVGRLESQLSMRVAEIEGRVNSLIFLRVLRRFGD